MLIEGGLEPRYRRGHAVLIENFSISQHQGLHKLVEYVDFKMTSWGRTEKISMPKSMFKNHFYLKCCLLIGESMEEESSMGVFE